MAFYKDDGGESLLNLKDAGCELRFLGRVRGKEGAGKGGEDWESGLLLTSNF